MRLRTCLDRTVSTALLLGPLVYALTLGVWPPAGPDPLECAAPPPAAIELTTTDDALLCEPEREGIETPAPAPVEPALVVEVEPIPDEREPPPQPNAAGAFYFVTKAGLVLTTDARAEWGHGRLRRASGDGEFNARKPVDPRGLPAEHWAARGRLFDLYGVDGKVCTARISSMSVIAQYFGVQIYDLAARLGYEDLDDMPASTWLPEVWDIGHHWLVGQLVSSERCDGALWARDASLPPPLLLRAASSESEAVQQRRRMFKAERKRLEDAYARSYEDDSDGASSYSFSWRELARTHPMNIQTWIDDAGREHFVELHFGVNEEGCGEGFDAEISTVHRVDGDALTPTSIRAGARAVFDADLDGRFEFLLPEHELISETPELDGSAEISWEGCLC